MKKVIPKQRKVKTTLAWFDLGCYPGEMLFANGMDYNQLVKALNKYKATNWLIGIEDESDLINNATWLALKRVVRNTKTSEETKLFYILIRDPFKFTDENYSLLAHEVVHICQFFLEDILDRNKEKEAEAYLHTHIMKLCLKALRGK